MTMEWYPKAFSPGDIEGSGALRLLGRPSVDELTLLVRETAQNSWDARNPGAAPSWEFHVRQMDPDQRHTLRTRVFSRRGMGIDNSCLDRSDLSVIEIADRNTAGLGGPIRNDQPVPSGGPTNYMDLVLTVGAGHGQAGRAGTYGFGKTIAYLASSMHTVVIWSRSIEHGVPESRLVASAIGDTFVHQNRRYTGRQWWGAPGGSTAGFSPLTGTAADDIARRLFDRGFERQETGTSLLIIQPQVRDTLAETAEDAADAVLWNLWPKLVPHPGAEVPPMDLRVRLNGRAVQLADPMTDPRTIGYATALQRIREDEASAEPDQGILTKRYEITYGTGHNPLGTLAIDARPSVMPSPVSSEPTGDAANLGVRPYTGNAHHVALMRHEAELVVEYLELDPPTSSNVQLYGVFRCSEPADREFAMAEPPAHDTWAPETVEDPRAKSHVRVALRKIRETWRDLARPATRPPNPSSGPRSVAIIANRLASLVSGTPGTRPEWGTGSRGRSRGGGGGGGRRTDGKPSVRIIGGAPETPQRSAVDFTITGLDGSIRVVTKLAIGYDGGNEDAAASEAAVIGYRPIDGDGHLVRSPILDLASGSPTDWRVLIEHADGLALDVEVNIEEVPG